MRHGICKFSISQVAYVPRAARALSLSVNEHHNLFEVQLAGELLELSEANRGDGIIEYMSDVSAYAGQEVELRITAKAIDDAWFGLYVEGLTSSSDPFAIPDGPDAGQPRALILDNIAFSSSSA